MTEIRPRLLLFDIDGTLLAPNGVGRAACDAAVQRLYGLPGLDLGYSFAGKIDWQILADLLAPLGYDADAVVLEMPRFAQEAARQMHLLLAQHDVCALPGTLDLIRDLRTDPRARLGLVTANMAVTAQIKLRAAGFDPADFPVGAFGDDARHRNDLPWLAVGRARQCWGLDFAGAAVVIVGDTPADIACGRAVGGRTVAVATGFASREALAAAQPDVFLDSLDDRAAVEVALFGEPTYE